MSCLPSKLIELLCLWPQLRTNFHLFAYSCDHTDNDKMLPQADFSFHVGLTEVSGV